MNAGLDKHVLSIERVLASPVARVFAAFSDPNQLALWWGPEGFTIPSLDFDPRTGARYTIEMQPPEGDAFFLRGEFRVVEPPHRLAFTFDWDPPDMDDVETLADLSFDAVDDATQLSLTQGPFKTRERFDLHEGGWSESLDKLRGFLANEPG